MLKKTLFPLLAFVTCAPLAEARASTALKCNEEQTRCVVKEANYLTIGDEVGIFNPDGELVATGQVKAMRGSTRAVSIKKRHGVIRKSHNLARLSDERVATDAGNVAASSSYRVYREPPRLSAGGGFGLSSVAIGDGSQAYELTGYAQWTWIKGLKIVARGVYSGLEGEVTRYGDNIDGADTRPISVTTFSALGGFAYVMRENLPLGFRTELSLGPISVDAKVDDNKRLNEDGGFQTHVKNGYALAGRGSAGAVWNNGAWHLGGDFVIGLYQDVFTKSVAVSLSKDMP